MLKTVNSLILRFVYIGEVCAQKCQQQQHVIVTTIIALANINDPILCRATQGGQGKYKSDCGVSMLPAFSP